MPIIVLVQECFHKPAWMGTYPGLWNVCLSKCSNFSFIYRSAIPAHGSKRQTAEWHKCWLRTESVAFFTSSHQTINLFWPLTHFILVRRRGSQRIILRHCWASVSGCRQHAGDQHQSETRALCLLSLHQGCAAHCPQFASLLTIAAISHII